MRNDKNTDTAGVGRQHKNATAVMLKGYLFSTFPAHLEAEFQKHYNESSEPIAWRAMILGECLYLAFYFWDVVIDYNHSMETLLIRIAVGTLIMILILLPRAVRARYLQTLYCGIIAIAGVGVVAIISLLRNGLNVGLSGVLLVLMFNFGFLRLLFIPSLVSGIVICLAYNVAAILGRLDPLITVANNFFLVAAIIAGASVTYLLEQLFRVGFLGENELEERNHQLALANLEKSRFLAAASHDLRQPMHALGLFVAQLRSHITSSDGNRLVDRIDDAVTGMNELFNALLDITKLDAGALTPTVGEFPIAELLGRIGSTFAPVAQEKKLSFRSVPSSAWVHSDPVLLERILLNLVSNAVRYTTAGGIVTGCRRRGDCLRIEVWDSGPGIPPEQRRKIFGEFYRLTDAAKTNQAGLGLGLAIVDRLCALLDHPIELTSTLGKGSRFGVTVPMAPARAAAQTEIEPPTQDTVDVARDKLVVVIDNDVRVLEGMGGLLRNWGCRVVTATTPEAALAAVNNIGAAARPDVVISDFHLGDGRTGITAIAKLREAFGPIPAFVMSGDTAPERLREAQESSHHLLHKPVQPMMLRAMVSRFLKSAHA
jgi:signal transduction histidine kinase